MISPRDNHTHMALDYTVTYSAENHYENLVKDAIWQFLIIPEDNENQRVTDVQFNNSLDAPVSYSENSKGFRTIRVTPVKPFNDISFTANFRLVKDEMNPFDFVPPEDPGKDYLTLDSLEFRVDHDSYLRPTSYTTVPGSAELTFQWDHEKDIFTNIQALNSWVYEYLKFTPGITTVETTLQDVLEHRKGVCQDFTHLFLALVRKHKIPARYVSGYLHQGSGYLGDSQMHAWAEVFIPRVGWIGFDPTNNLLVGSDHIKVAHGRDYSECSPLIGVLYTLGENQTSHAVGVACQQ